MRERPLGGPLLTRGTAVALLVACAALLLVGVRLLAGLGAVSAMNDGYPWGLWKPLNVVSFTGVGAGALALALVAHVANRRRFHPLVRSAVLVGAIAYTLAGASVIVDLGRWWAVWALLVPPWWNLDSVLLEVALCVMAYCAVLWLEVLPAVLEPLRDRGGRAGALAARLLPWHERGFPFLVALAIVLPLMHQSSLGSLFLLSCLVMGFAAVIAVDALAPAGAGRERDGALVGSLAAVLASLAAAFAVLRVAEVALAGELGAVHGPKGLLFLVELALLAYPAIRLLAPSYRRNGGYRLWAALLALAGGALYRFDTYLAAFDPGNGWSYFPSVGELLFSAGLVAIGLVLYLLCVKRLPILATAAGTAAPPVRRRAA